MSTQDSPEPYYSMARRAGDLLYLSGFGPVDANLNVVGTTIEEQTEATMSAIQRVLEQEGVSFSDVVRVNIFLSNIDRDRDGFNATYIRFFKDAHRMPTRRTTGAGALYKGILIEIDCVAYQPRVDIG
jgi:enamine deaminase RidA (YjgF/YER057c/UK114 family)